MDAERLWRWVESLRRLVEHENTPPGERENAHRRLEVIRKLLQEASTSPRAEEPRRAWKWEGSWEPPSDYSAYDDVDLERFERLHRAFMRLRFVSRFKFTVSRSDEERLLRWLDWCLGPAGDAWVRPKSRVETFTYCDLYFLEKVIDRFINEAIDVIEQYVAYITTPALPTFIAKTTSEIPLQGFAMGKSVILNVVDALPEIILTDDRVQRAKLKFLYEERERRSKGKFLDDRGELESQYRREFQLENTTLALESSFETPRLEKDDKI